jgi:hypothetical protein
MKGTTSAIYNALTADTTLIGMLGSNTPFFDQNGTSAKVNSVVLSDQVRSEMNTPFITLQEGNENRTGWGMMRQSFFIRVYNDPRKSYIKINEILDRVRLLIDRVDLELSDRTLVECRMESRLPALEDEGFQLKYKEERYGIIVL